MFCGRTPATTLVELLPRLWSDAPMTGLHFKERDAVCFESLLIDDELLLLRWTTSSPSESRAFRLAGHCLEQHLSVSVQQLWRSIGTVASA